MKKRTEDRESSLSEDARRKAIKEWARDPENIREVRESMRASERYRRKLARRRRVDPEIMHVQITK